MKVLELFGGIGSPRKALKRLNIGFEVVDYVEIDKYAVKSYNAIYNENYLSQDILQWDKDLEVDLIFHGSPCQDFSLAGKQRGGEEDSGTRSSLLFETVRIVKKLNPKYIIWENVKSVLNKKHIDTFNSYLNYLEELGYTNYFKVLNAKDFNIPQNRERVYTVSIFNDISKSFKFPNKIELKFNLSDFLESNVDKKYFLSDKMIQYIASTNKKWTGNNNGALINKNIASCINTAEGTRRCDASNYISKLYPNNYDLQDHLSIKNATKKGYINGYIGDGVDLAYPNSTTRRGRVQNKKSNTITTSDNLGVIVAGQFQPKDRDYKRKGIKRTEQFEIRKDNISNTVLTRASKNMAMINNLQIRKFTPLECFRLMGFDDIDYKRASLVNSNTQLYKQAGNSIVVNVLEAIFKELFKEKLK